MKLNIKEEAPEAELTSSQVMDQKFHLLGIADQFLTPE
jgi:hypothetical protein